MADRGVSTVVSYVLVLAIVAILSSSLIGAFGPFVTNQQQSTAQSTLEVFGNDIAGDIDSADRLSRDVGANGTVALRTRLPQQVGGSPYEIEIARTAGETYEITLRTDEFDASSIVVVRTRTPVAERTGADALDGGLLRIVYEPGSDRLVVRNA